ncbi:hypothetical protein R1flu_025862 [Riccia fluitans]|uniref:Uncharacterized protein n=1 Tax=Riccia fluitans TaxID=41844 RepID=A0ABD1XZC4_9MARC
MTLTDDEYTIWLRSATVRFQLHCVEGHPILDNNSFEDLRVVVRFFDLISTAVEVFGTFVYLDHWVDNGSERDRTKHPFLQPPSLLQIEEVVEASDSDEQDKGNSACRRICLESETAGPG